SNSATQPAFKAENFFALQVGRLDIYQTTFTNMILENSSSTINYGNSHFGMLSLLAPNNNLYAGLIIRSSNSHPMNLCKFDSVFITGEYYNQPNGRGIVLDNASYNTFSFVDVE